MLILRRATRESVINYYHHKVCSRDWRCRFARKGQSVDGGAGRSRRVKVYDEERTKRWEEKCFIIAVYSFLATASVWCVARKCIRHLRLLLASDCGGACG